MKCAACGNIFVPTPTDTVSDKWAYQCGTCQQLSKWLASERERAYGRRIALTDPAQPDAAKDAPT